MALVQIVLRNDSASNWNIHNPTLELGELGLENNTGLFKIGDGSTAWNSLAYGGLQGPAGSGGYVATSDTGTVNAITADFDPDIVTHSGDMMLVVRHAITNTGPVQITIDALDAKDVYKYNNEALEPGDIPGNGYQGLYRYDSTLDKYQLLNPSPKIIDSINLYYENAVQVQTGQARWYPPRDVALLSVEAHLNGAPDTGLTLIPDLLKNGTSITPTTKPQIAAGSTDSAIVDISGNSLTTTDYLTVDILSRGGAELVISVKYR